MKLHVVLSRSTQLLLAIVACLLAPCLAVGQTAPPLGVAESFAVLGGSAVTNTGPTSIVGDLGVSPGTAVTGFPPGVVVNGAIHANDAVAQQAQSDVTNAYNNLAGQAPDTDLTGQDLGGMTLVPGVYLFTSSAQLTGTLTFDAQGDPDAVFVVQIGSTLTTASASSVVVINGGSDCNVFWQVGSSATLGTGSDIAGNILALTSITMTTGATLSGRALARNGAGQTPQPRQQLDHFPLKRVQLSPLWDETPDAWRFIPERTRTRRKGRPCANAICSPDSPLPSCCGPQTRQPRCWAAAAACRASPPSPALSGSPRWTARHGSASACPASARR